MSKCFLKLHRFGQYRVPNLSYPNILALFSEFSKEFDLIADTEVNKELGLKPSGHTLLSVSKKRRIALFQEDLRKILHAAPERAVRLVTSSITIVLTLFNKFDNFSCLELIVSKTPSLPNANAAWTRCSSSCLVRASKVP